MDEEKRCGMCKHWEQSSGFPHYDGGFPGRCLATTPLWVDLRFGPFTIDRQMPSTEDARRCAHYEGASNEHV